MTTDQLTARIAIVEVMAMTSLGLYLANHVGDENLEKARSFIDQLRGHMLAIANDLPTEEARVEGRDYVDHIASELLANVRLLRG